MAGKGVGGNIKGIANVVTEVTGAIISEVKELVGLLSGMVDSVLEQMDAMKGTEKELKQKMQVALEDVRQIADYGYRFVDDVYSVAWFFASDRLSRVTSAVQQNNYQPLHDFLQQVKLRLEQAHYTYQQFKTACREASRTTNSASADANKAATAANSKKKKTRFLGGLERDGQLPSVAR